MEEIRTRRVAMVTAMLMAAAVILWIVLMLLGVGKREPQGTSGVLAAGENVQNCSVFDDEEKEREEIERHSDLYFAQNQK